MKKYFALKLKPSRPDFAQTMTDNEKKIMQQHVVYWKKHMQEGRVVVFGPVLDPAAVYGLGVIVVDGEDEVTGFIKNDPASTINEYEYYPMLALVPES